MKPSAYKHIAAWGRHFNLSPDAVCRMQRIASSERAPVDAVYRTSDGWKTIAQCGIQTRMTLERILNHGVSK